MRVFYYPGCSSEHLARDLHLAVETLWHTLEIPVEILPDWNCCGAREGYEAGEVIGLALAARNLALAQEASFLITTCSLCFYNLKRADILLRKDPQLLERVNLVLKEAGLQYHPGRIRPLHLLEFLSLKEILALLVKQVRPENGPSVVSYYGCFLSRPYGLDLLSMEKILQVCGYEVKPFTLKTHCCGGHLPRTDSPVIRQLCGRLFLEAEMRGANMIAVSCPVCKLNLELYGAREGGPQVVYFPQLLALSLGIPPALLGITEATP